jgi:hypothetical protein
MKIALELSAVDANLLRCLAPRGNARKDGYMETTAKNLLVSAMRKEARLRRVTSSQVDVAALTEAVERRKRRIK